MMEKDFVHIGTVIRPHGIKGELCIDWYADSLELLEGRLFLQAGKTVPRSVVCAGFRWHRGRLLVRLEGIADRTCAETLRGMRLLIRHEDLPALAEDEAYLCDLPGLEVCREDGVRLGVLHHVEFPADREVWSIMTDDKQEILFPAREEFIVSLDIAAGRICIAPPPGLLEIYLTPLEKDSGEAVVERLSG